MAAGESALIHIAPDDSIESIATRIRGAGATNVQLLVPDGTAALQSLGGFRSHAVTSCGTDTDLLRRLWKAGHRIVHAPRLSVLKFPSVWWGAYRTDAALPQEWWLARDPNDVERELLTGAVLMLATTRPHANPRRAFALALRNGLRWLRNRVEGERGAIAALMRARFRRSLRDVRRRRGLPSSRA